MPDNLQTPPSVFVITEHKIQELANDISDLLRSANCPLVAQALGAITPARHQNIHVGLGQISGFQVLIDRRTVIVLESMDEHHGPLARVEVAFQQSVAIAQQKEIWHLRVVPRVQSEMRLVANVEFLFFQLFGAADGAHEERGALNSKLNLIVTGKDSLLCGRIMFLAGGKANEAND